MLIRRSKALRLAGYPQGEYWMLPLAWEFVRNFEFYDSYKGQWRELAV